jgi:hypothetical protein
MEENKNIPPKQTPKNIPVVEQNETPTSSGKIISSEENILPEIEQSEIPPSSGAETIKTTNTEKETDMEVHHHTHPTHGKKNWKDYFWEFLMLFLAVFCGFLAEYQLEHKIERDREKEFIETMISDLKEDTTLLNTSIANFKQKGIELDSLIILLNSTNIKDHGSELYYYGRKANRFTFFATTDRTIQQMKNSGAFRLIRNNHAASNILQYYSEMNDLNLLQDNTNDVSKEYRSITYTLFNTVVFETMVNDETKNIIIKPVGNPSLINYDKSAIERLSSLSHYMKASRLVLYDRYIILRKKATELIELLKKEYHLK